jgi:drug/metabolite transporter (DMT)-like permease
VIRLFTVAFIWGWSFLLIKVIVEGAPPTFVAWSRITLGFVVMYAFLRAAKERLPERRQWGHVVVLALLLSVIPFSLISWGEERITSALASVLNATTALFAALFAAIILKERLRPPQLFGLALGFVSVGIVAGVGGRDLAHSSLIGSLAVVGATACYGLAFPYTHRFVANLSPVQQAAGPLLAGSLILLPVTAVGIAADGIELTALRVLCVVLLGCLGTGYAMMLNFRTLRDLGPTTASLVTYLIPVVGVTVGVTVGGEPFSIRVLVGCVLIALSIALVQGRILGGRRTAEPATVEARR